MIKKKICVVTGSWSEFGLMTNLLREINKSKKLKLILLVTGMHLMNEFGNTYKEIKQGGFKISKKIKLVESISIKDYAYESAPDSSIIAGDNGSGLVGVSSNLDDVEVTMLNNNLQVLNNSSYKELQLTVTNISGQTVINSQLHSSTETIGMNEFASGIYLVKVNSESKSYIKKIYVR